MELDPVTPLLGILERDDGDRRRLGRYLETIGDREDSVAVARPGLLGVGRAGEEALVTLDDQVGPAILPDLDSPHLPALHERHELHPVTDAEHRRPEVEEIRPHPRRPLLVYAIGPARKDDTLRILRPYLFHGRVVRDHLREHAAFPHTPGDQLRILPTEIQYQYQGSLRQEEYCLPLLPTPLSPLPHDRFAVISPFRRPGSAARPCLRWRGRGRT